MQERLIALVAEHLLDRNGEERMAAGKTEEFRLNLARNVADAIDLLPKLVGSASPTYRRDHAGHLQRDGGALGHIPCPM